tara:strand:+ start:9181 stop:9369 length:189 start_codon:yes stop_codon:yes gene_type:complete
MKVGDLVRHEKYGVGLLVNITKAALEINGRTHHYEVRWVSRESNPATAFQWRDHLEVINESR